MKVSIITVVFNSCKTIGHAIESVLSQRYPHIEHILIDGNSTDNTLEVINSYKQANIKCISEPDKGIYDAMNKGLKIASGDIIGFLNADDFYRHTYVINQIVAAFSQYHVDSVYGDLVYVQAENTQKVIRYWKSGQYKEGNFLKGWMPPHPTFFARKEVYEKYNNFDVRLKSAADYELMLRFIHKHKISVAYIPDVLVAMRAGGKSNASLKNRLTASVEDRLAWKLNKIKATPFTFLLKPLRKIEQYFFTTYQPQVSDQIYLYSHLIDLRINSTVSTLSLPNV
jgi:glycosyltransferase involved in cell wall biosynthesis